MLVMSLMVSVVLQWTLQFSLTLLWQLLVSQNVSSCWVIDLNHNSLLEREHLLLSNKHCNQQLLLASQLNKSLLVQRFVVEWKSLSSFFLEEISSSTAFLSKTQLPSAAWRTSRDSCMSWPFCHWVADEILDDDYFAHSMNFSNQGCRRGSWSCKYYHEQELAQV